MKSHSVVKLAVAALVALGGCAAPSLPTPAPLGAVADRGPSWISREASSSNELLYISDEANFDVYIYSFPALKLVGKLTGFNQPEGECTDRKGDLWIANTGNERILEFAPGKKQPIQSFLDPTGYPGSCAIDASSGDLAVTNTFGFSGAGGILIYRHARGVPVVYSNPHQYYYYFDGYDARGNLYVDGMTSGYGYALSELPNGKHSMTNVTVSGATLHLPGTVQFDGSTLVLGDQECNGGKSSCLYEASASGSNATITGSTALGGSCDVAQAVVQNGDVAAGNYAYCSHSKSSTAIWAYPAGGKATASVTGVHIPLGAAIGQASAAP